MTREDLARRQAELLAALLGDGPPPKGFDPRRLAVEANALRAKRRRITERLRPDLLDTLGDRFAELHRAYASENPRHNSHARHDTAAFEQWLTERGELNRPRRRWFLRPTAAS